MPSTPAVTPPPPAGSAEPDDALLRACRSVLAPLARLAVARGLRHGQLDEMLRSAFVEAAREAHADTPAHRSVSRVSAATGLHRREVTRLMSTPNPDLPRRSLATQLFTRWLSDPSLRHRGAPRRELPRQGPAPSFESLAQSVTKDVHPRTLLEEVCRLGLAAHDAGRDVVVLQRDRFVPAGDDARLLGFLGANVGDHLAASVRNVIGEGPRQLEQAVFADELSVLSIEKLEPLVRGQWQAMLRELAPAMQAMIDEDAAQDRVRNQRLRVGMYAHSAPMAVVPDTLPAIRPAPAPAKKATPRRRSP